MARSSLRTAGLALVLAAGPLACPAGPLGTPPEDGPADAGSVADAGGPECSTDADCADSTGWCDRGTCETRQTSDGEGEQYLQPSVMQDDGGGLVVTPLPETFGYPFAVAQARGVPVVFAAESEGDALDGAVRVHLDPFGSAPRTERLEGVLSSTRQQALGDVADLDGDGDLDLLAFGDSRFGVVLDDGAQFRVLGARDATLRGAAGVVDLDQDGTVDIFLAGMNTEYWIAKVVDGTLQADRYEQRWQVEHDFYCAGSFVGGVVDASPVLLMVGRWCGGDPTVAWRASGPARLFLLDVSMTEVHSVDLNAEDAPAVMLVGTTAYVTGLRYTVDPNDGGEWQATMAIGVSPAGFTSFGFVDDGTRIAGFAGSDGDGTVSWVGSATSPPGDFVQIPAGFGLTAVGDADGDGRDELFMSQWPWRLP